MKDLIFEVGEVRHGDGGNEQGVVPELLELICRHTPYWHPKLVIDRTRPGYAEVVVPRKRLDTPSSRTPLALSAQEPGGPEYSRICEIDFTQPNTVVRLHNPDFLGDTGVGNRTYEAIRDKLTAAFPH